MTSRNSFIILVLAGLVLFAFFSNEIGVRDGEYQNLNYHFALVPKDGMEVLGFDEGGGAKTFIFENLENGAGFQIFAVPYADESITEERFKMDIPSGVRENMREMEVDDVTATVFYSQSFELGETYEVWFIKGSLLYEVTTIRSLESELDEIMKTWRFI